MKAPEKIYIKCHQAARGTIYLATEKSNNGARLQYIRKDALLKHLNNERLAKLVGFSKDYKEGREVVLYELIDFINSL